MDVSFVLAMSIAVTVVVRPSPVLYALLCGMCICIALAGVAIGFSWVGDLTMPFRLSIASACILVSVICFFTEYNCNTYLIAISGDGQIRLSEQGPVIDATLPSACNDAFGEVLLVSLQEDSILWPFLLLLRLKADNGKTFIVPICPDGLSVPGFRCLSVACRWIAMHNKSAQKI